MKYNHAKKIIAFVEEYEAKLKQEEEKRKGIAPSDDWEDTFQKAEDLVNTALEETCEGAQMLTSTGDEADYEKYEAGIALGESCGQLGAQTLFCVDRGDVRYYFIDEDRALGQIKRYVASGAWD